MSNRFWTQVTAAGLVLASGTVPAHARTIVYSTVALTGTDGVYGPGMGAGVTYFALGGQQPSVNGAGQVAFRGQSSTTGNPNGIWLRSGGVNSNVGISGGPQPGGGTYASTTFNTPQLNNAGQMAWRLGASNGLFGDNGSGAGRVVLAGDAAPGTGGATYSGVASGTPLFNQSGQTAYIGNLTTGTGSPPVTISSGVANSSGIWKGTPGSGNQALVIRQNDPVLSLDAGGNVRVGSMQNLSMSFNGNGRYVVSGALQGSVTTGTGAGSNAGMIATDRGGSLEVVARVGNAAPDASGNPTANLYRGLTSSAIGFNNAGRVAFTSSLRDAVGTQTATGALFTDTIGGTLRMMAKVGDALPAIANANGSEFAGVTWGQSYNNLCINSAGTLAFSPQGLGNTGSSFNTGAIMLLDSLGQFSKVMRNGDVAIPHGAPDGTDATFLSTSNMQLNSAGQVAFLSNLTGHSVSVGLGNGLALYATDPAGALKLIARSGDDFEFSPGIFKTISAIGGLATSGGQDGRPINFTDSGQLAFELDFTDGSSGVYVATVPGPGALALLGLGALVGARRRRF